MSKKNNIILDVLCDIEEINPCLIYFCCECSSRKCTGCPIATIMKKLNAICSKLRKYQEVENNKQKGIRK